jgi:hypothetical protein
MQGALTVCLFRRRWAASFLVDSSILMVLSAKKHRFFG